MATDVGRIETDMLFLALTRPAIVLGVTYSWFLVEGMGWLLYFINTSSFYVVPGAAATHLIGILIIAKEPRFMEIVKIWLLTTTRCLNKRYYKGTSSYDLY